MTCGAVRCRALPCCGAASCCAVLSNIQQYQVYVLCTRLFSFSSFELSRSPCFLPHAYYARIADQNVTPPTNTQHSTGQAPLHKQLLALSIRCSHKNHGPFLSAPFTCFSCIRPCARVACGVGRPRGGVLYDERRRLGYSRPCPPPLLQNCCIT